MSVKALRAILLLILMVPLAVVCILLATQSIEYDQQTLLITTAMYATGILVSALSNTDTRAF